MLHAPDLKSIKYLASLTQLGSGPINGIHTGAAM